MPVRPSPSAASASSRRQSACILWPRVVQLIVFCALIGMLLAVPAFLTCSCVVAASAGIWLVAGPRRRSIALVERKIDARMARTAWRPTAKGQLGDGQTLLFAGVLCAAGSALPRLLVNPLTMWLTLATFVGYAPVYTVSAQAVDAAEHRHRRRVGAMPPVLGWAAMSDASSRRR